MTEHDEGVFLGAGGLKFYYQCWRPEIAPPRAILAFVRSLRSHAGLYTAVETRLVPQGYALYGFAHREHGRSPEQPGYLQEWGESLDDIRAFLEVVRAQEPDLPLFLMGNGLGGRMVQAYALHHPAGLAGVAVFDPAGERQDTHPLLMRLIRALSQVWPGFTIPNQPDASAISPHPATIDAAQDEPQAQHDETVRLHLEGTLAGERHQASESDPAIPFLSLQVDADHRMSTPDSAAYYDRALGNLEIWMEQLLLHR